MEISPIRFSQGFTLSTLSDSKSSSFTQAVTSTFPSESSAYIFYATLSSGGADTVTATFSRGNFANIYIYEVSGVVTTGATTGSNAGTGSSFSTSPSTAAFLSGSFLLGVIATNNGANVPTAGTGFTLSPISGAGGTVGFAEYSTSGISSPTSFPATNNQVADWAEAGIALQPAPTPPPPIPEYPLGLPILAIFMIIGYGLVKRRAVTKQK